MARCYSGTMLRRQPHLIHRPLLWPLVWLVSDARNDAVLETLLRALPRGSGLIFRHYHLTPAERRARFRRLAAISRRRGHRLALSGTAREARAWGADAAYGPPERLARGPAAARLVTAHSLREIAAARRARADAILLSPVFATRSHPHALALGPLRFRLLCGRVGLPVIALGGMNARRARRAGAMRWAAIDSLSSLDS